MAMISGSCYPSAMTSRAASTRSDQPHSRPHWRERDDLTLADIEDLVQEGAFTDDDRVELFDGRLVAMSPKGRRHEIVRGELAYLLTIGSALTEAFVISEPQLNLSDKRFKNPDLLVHSKSLKTPDVRGPTTQLVIEISDSSLDFDLRTKAPIYAAHGVREYWVIHAWTLETIVHRDPSATGFGSTVSVQPDAKLSALLLPWFTVQLDQLDI
jgi:Uma2 family endonuclease